MASSDRFEYQTGIAAAEAERIGNGNADLCGPCLIGDVTKITFRVGFVQIDRRRQSGAFHRRQAGQCFDGGGGG